MRKLLILSVVLGMSSPVIGSGSYGSASNSSRKKAQSMKQKGKEVKSSNFKCQENEVLKDCIDRYKKAKAASKK